MDVIKSPTLVNHILETIFLYLDVRSLNNCSLVCKDWYRLLVNENSYIWKVKCMGRLPLEVWELDLLSSLTTWKEKLRAHYYAWNPNDCSKNISILTDGFTLLRSPTVHTTDACRGKIGFTSGKHIWEVIWNGPLGNVAVIGIATKDAPLTAKGYYGLLGTDENSWGWNLLNNDLVHDGLIQGQYPYWEKNKKKKKEAPPKYRTGERFRVILDCDDNILSFERNHEWLGPAFSDLPVKRFYPCISAVYGNTQASLVYIGSQLSDNTII